MNLKQGSIRYNGGFFRVRVAVSASWRIRGGHPTSASLLALGCCSTSPDRNKTETTNRRLVFVKGHRMLCSLAGPFQDRKASLTQLQEKG